MSFIKKKKMPGRPDPVHRGERVGSHNNGHSGETEASRKLVENLTSLGTCDDNLCSLTKPSEALIKL